VENPESPAISGWVKLTTFARVKSLLFPNVCFPLSDLLIVDQEGRILHFVPGSMRVEARNRKLTFPDQILYSNYPDKQIFALSLIIIYI